MPRKATWRAEKECFIRKDAIVIDDCRIGRAFDPICSTQQNHYRHLVSPLFFLSLKFIVKTATTHIKCCTTTFFSSENVSTSG
eukprot:m.36716 g.36716  ORF g.36716 m.36716 type:complete len:83 (+) comp32270_c0_seq1:290-538(+)